MSAGDERRNRLMEPFQGHIGGRSLPGNVCVDGGYWNPYNMLYAVIDRMTDEQAKAYIASWSESYDRNAAAFGAEIASRMAGDRIIAECRDEYVALMTGKPVASARRTT